MRSRQNSISLVSPSTLSEHNEWFKAPAHLEGHTEFSTTHPSWLHWHLTSRPTWFLRNLTEKQQAKHNTGMNPFIYECDLNTRLLHCCPSRCSLAEECRSEFKRSHHDAGLAESMRNISTLQGSRTQRGHHQDPFQDRWMDTLLIPQGEMYLEGKYSQVDGMHVFLTT